MSSPALLHLLARRASGSVGLDRIRARSTLLDQKRQPGRSTSRSSVVASRCSCEHRWRVPRGGRDVGEDAEWAATAALA
jgi:hypothetical protein